MEDYGQADAQLLDAANMIYGTLNFNAKSFSLFYIGPKEYNVIPGNGTGENNVLKKQWQDIRIRTQAPNRLLWRQIFSNHFDQHALYRSTNVSKSKAKIQGYQIYPFKLDGLEFVSVVHYLLFQLYLPDPEYALLFSLHSRENERAFWGKLDTALEEHQKNLKEGGHPYAPDFMNKLPSYIYNANLAKLSQHEDLKEVLLATGDAYLAERIQGDKLYEIGKPILMRVRQVLSENPELVYFETGQQDVLPEELMTKVRKIREVESYNFNYQPANSTIAGGVTLNDLQRPFPRELFLKTFSKSGFAPKEEIRKDLRWIYKIVRPLNVQDPADVVSNFSYSFKVVERNVYGFTRNFDNANTKVIVGYEKFVTSKTKLYLRYETNEDRTFYFEPFQKDGSILYYMFVITSKLDQFLISSFDNFQYEQPATGYYQPIPLSLPTTAFTDSQLRRINNNRTIVNSQLTTAQAAYQYLRVEEFKQNKKILSYNDILKEQIYGALQKELLVRSYSNGETLLYAPGSSFAREFSSRFGLDLRVVKSYFEMETLPDQEQNLKKLPQEILNPPPGISLKHWLLINTIENIKESWHLRNGLLQNLNKARKIDEIVFKPFPFKESDNFRGFSWLTELPVLEKKEQGLLLVCEVPQEKTIEGLFLQRLRDRIQEAKVRAQPLQILITCRAKGPLYDFLMNDQDVLFRKNLDGNYILENPFTGSLQSNKKNLLMAVVGSDVIFSGFVFELLQE